MNIFVTLEQAKALKEAGFPQEKSHSMYFQLCAYHTHMLTERQYETRGAWDKIDAPSVAELMEEMKPYNVCVRWEGNFNKWGVYSEAETFKSIYNPDLLEALVEAYCRLGGKL